ncbi:ubiquinol-cytochrome-c reductase cytochrome c1 protein [Rutstroemia sp. NJR-2017a BVV2]|nr:ubiquinol-cytochrome-c reductase cytochrome c1 protein [Rutstroemia sp. NJR-2017a BVV2]
MTTTQRELEECCFDFAAKWLPSILEDHKWDCAEAAELNKWTSTLVARYGKLPAHAINNDSETPLQDVFLATTVVRHTAVHRLPVTAQGIQKMIQSALQLARTLGDHSRAEGFEGLHLEMESRIRDMELNKNFLENRFDEQLQVISEQRAELDRQEKEALATMLQEDQKNKQLVGSFLEGAVKAIFGQRDEIGIIKSTNMVNSAHEDDRNDRNEIQNVAKCGST